MTLNEFNQIAQQRRQQRQGLLQQGGFDALFANAKPVGGSLDEALAAGNQAFNPFGTATNYSPDQVRAMSQSMPMSIGETGRVAYKGQIYNNPMGGQMQMWNAMSPQQRNQMVSGIQGAGAGTWREQDFMAGGGTQAPAFDQLGGAAPTSGAVTGGPSTVAPNFAAGPQMQQQQAPQPQWQPQPQQQAPQQPPQQFTAMPMPQVPSGYGLGFGSFSPYGMGGMGGGGLFGAYGGGYGGGGVPGGFGGYGSQVVRYW
jgi:hypothetical protein